MPLRYRTSRGTGSLSWLFQRVSGLVLIVLVILHYFLMHYHMDRGHTYKSVFEALTDPTWGPWLKMMDLTMLALGLWHGLNGTWGVIRDYELSPAWSMAILSVLITVGIGLGVMGFATIVSF